MPKVRAVVFDIDGTLLDTTEFISQAYEQTLKAHNMPARSRQEIASQIGRKIEECYAFLAPNSDIPKMVEYHGTFQKANLALIKAFDHVEAIIKELRSMGLKVALWTGRREHVLSSLEYARVDPNAFDAIVDSTMVKAGKPHPEGLFTTLEMIGVEPEAAVMVGDSRLDIQAGKSAGIAATIGLTHGFGTREELEHASADYILDSLEYLPSVIDNIE